MYMIIYDNAPSNLLALLQGRPHLGSRVWYVTENMYLEMVLSRRIAFCTKILLFKVELI